MISTVLKGDNQKKHITEILVHTGQHYDFNMSDVFFEQMGLKQPDYCLEVGSGSHAEMTAKILERLEPILMDIKANVVLVYGDTNSTLAGALAAAKLNIPVAHVEAGMRSFVKSMPEEVNRVVADHLSSLLFCATDTAVQNLQREGFADDKIIQVGDVMYDAFLCYKDIALKQPGYTKFRNRFPEEFYLATVHRAENTDNAQNLREITNALDTISKNIPVVFPVHPRTQKVIKDQNIQSSHIHFLEPLGYFDLLILLQECKAVFTDSGGLQKEAFFSKKPCIVLRNETEWQELVTHKFNVLAGSKKEKILEAELSIENYNHDYSLDLYGDGHAGEKIVEHLVKVFS